MFTDKQSQLRLWHLFFIRVAKSFFLDLVLLLLDQLFLLLPFLLALSLVRSPGRLVVELLALLFVLDRLFADVLAETDVELHVEGLLLVAAALQVPLPERVTLGIR